MSALGIENFILIGTLLMLIFILCLIVFIAVFQNRARNREIKQEKLLSEAMIKSQENERRKIGEELHEDISPVLVSALINLNILVNKSKDFVESNIENAIENVELAIKKIRNISHQLHPAAIEKFGLLLGLKDFARSINNSKNVTIRIQSTFEELNLDSFVQLIIFRIIQELIINAIKHGNSKNIHLELNSENNLLQISISNDGIKFNAQTYKSGIENTDSLGLKIVQQKLYLLSGTIKFNSNPKLLYSNIVIQIPMY
ncbi:MAG: ATP-binding protein [Saprospiraceae bacterium]